MTSGSFSFFGSVHSLTLLVIGLLAALLVFLARFRPSATRNRLINIFLAVVIVINELAFVFVLIFSGYWDYHYHLPLNLCDLTIIAVVISLLWYRKWVWELAYFWALTGTVQALLTPEISQSFPSYIYLKFFLSHGLVIVAVVYLAAGCGRTIERAYIKRVFWATNLYALAAGTFNFLFDANYGYLCAKPLRPSVLDYFGSWPYYLFALELILIASLYLYYLPFYLVQKR